MINTLRCPRCYCDSLLADWNESKGICPKCGLEDINCILENNLDFTKDFDTISKLVLEGDS